MIIMVLIAIMVIVAIVTTTVIVIVATAVLQRLIQVLIYDGGNSHINHTDFSNYGSTRSHNLISSMTTSNVTQSIINHA